MKKPLTLGMAWFASSAVALASLSAPLDTIRVPQDYPTISAAIVAANPGDRIKVSNGVYREQVIIDKPIRLEGSSSEHTIIDGEAGSLASMGQVRIVAAGDVEVSDFKIVNAGGADDAGILWHVAIFTASPVMGVTYDVHDTNIFRAGLDPINTRGYGLHSQSGLGHLDFHDCHVSEQNNCAVYLVNHSGPLTIEDNFFGLGLVAGDPVYISNLSMGVINTPQRVNRNRFTMGTPQAELVFPTAITFGTDGGSGYSNVKITQNRIEDITANRRGISFFAEPGAIMRGSVERNEILGNGGYTGISIWGHCEQVLVAHNLITGITGEALNTPGTNGGIRLRSLGPGFSPVGTRIFHNEISALRGISVEGDASANLIRRNRIWAQGPVAVELAADTSGNAVVQNWLRTPSASGNDTVLNAGANNIVGVNR
jgi:hypothetical protein